MLTLTFPEGRLRTVLCLGAHCDDIEIGCGGTIRLLGERFPDARFHWAVFSATDVREAETRHAASRIHAGVDHAVDVPRFRGSYFPSCFDAIKDHFEDLKSRLEPDLIFTHRLEDRHQDHRILAELTWNTFRNHTILEYEIPKYDGDLGLPNVFVPLSQPAVDEKVDMLLTCFPTQTHRPWFTADLFRGHLRLRGAECNAPSGYAEALYARKLVF